MTWLEETKKRLAEARRELAEAEKELGAGTEAAHDRYTRALHEAEIAELHANRAYREAYQPPLA